MKMVVVQKQVNEKIEDQLQSLNDEFQELKTKTSSLRKSGKDTRMAEVLLLDFAPKLIMARATYERDEIKKLKNLIQYIKDELKESEEGSDFQHALELVKDAYESLRNDKAKEASVAYSAVIKIYKDLPEDLKRTIFRACLDIRKRIEKTS